MVVNHEEAPLDERIRIPPGLRELEVHYTGLSLVAPHKTRFRYMLDGFEQDWVEVGERRVALYTNVPPGSYRFRVQAANNDGVWSDSEASFEVSVPARFYELTSFRSGLVVALLLGGFAVYRQSVRRVKARNERLEEQINEVNARIEAEAGLRESEARYHSLLENAPFGIVELDFQGKILSLNNTGFMLIGQPAKPDRRGVDYLEMLHTRRVTKSRAISRRCGQVGSSRSSFASAPRRSLGLCRTACTPCSIATASWSN